MLTLLQCLVVKLHSVTLGTRNNKNMILAPTPIHETQLGQTCTDPSFVCVVLDYVMGILPNSGLLAVKMTPTFLP